jgi:MYXO-CTERM domain-containing protein
MPRPFLTALVAACLLQPAASAAYLPSDQVLWIYQFTAEAGPLAAEGGGGSAVTFSPGGPGPAWGNNDLVASSLRVVSDAPVDAPDVLTQGYTLRLTIATIEDGEAHAGTWTFRGTLSGPVSSEATNVRNVFEDPYQQTLTLGSYDFEVSLLEYHPPGPPGQEGDGLLSVHVHVQNASWPWFNDGPDIEQIPEPSSGVLAALGIVGAAWWRRRPRPA